MKQPFHLSLPVRSLQDCVDFYVTALQGEVTRRDASGYVDVDVPGCRLTLHEVADMPSPDDRLHFGINLDLETFEAVAGRVLAEAEGSLVERPHTVDAGTPAERRKMFLRCPSGYLVEIKGQGESE